MGAVMTSSHITYTHLGCGKAPPVKMESVPLTKDDVLLHLRTDAAPYMIAPKAGSWTHLIGCMLAYVLQRQDMFDICLQAYLRTLVKEPERFEAFKQTLRERLSHNNKGKDRVRC